MNFVPSCASASVVSCSVPRRHDLLPQYGWRFYFTMRSCLALRHKRRFLSRQSSPAKCLPTPPPSVTRITEPEITHLPQSGVILSCFDSESLQCQKTAPKLVLQSSRFVLCFFVSFWLSLLELMSTFQMGCSTKCALLRRSGTACHQRRGVGQARNRWNPSCTQHPLESTGGSVIHGKPTAPPYAAEIHLWTRNSTLRRAARVPLQPSNCCHHLV